LPVIKTINIGRIASHSHCAFNSSLVGGIYG
jgi:hypothetical protein